MLVLSRKTGESIIIGDDIKVTIIKHDRHSIKIGIIAPKETSIHREEVYLRIKEEKANGQQTR